MNNPNIIKQLFKEFQEKPIAYQRIYSELTGSVVAGLVLSQLVYWDKAMKHKWFYKTDQDFSDELEIGLYELRGAKKKIKELKLVEIKLKGIPAKTNYKVNTDLLISKIISLRKNRKLDCGKTTKKFKEKPQTITESNTEIKSDINNNALFDKQKALDIEKLIRLETKQSIKRKTKKTNSKARFLEEYLGKEDIVFVIDNPEVAKAIYFYADIYKELIDKTHPRVKIKQWNRIKTQFKLFNKEHSPGADGWKLMIEDWFKSKAHTDFNVNHFVAGNIMENRYYEVGL